MKYLFITILFLGYTFTAAAQAGLYKSADDFLNGTLAYEQQEFEKHRLHTDIPINKLVVKVKDGGESHKFFKWDLYGYKSRKNENFRFYNEKSYKIVDTTAFLIYSREENIIDGKARTRQTRYYFSKGPESRIVPLTIRNLKHAFPNREFHDLLDLQFRNNRELVMFDSFNKEYKLKRIFLKTMS